MRRGRWVVALDIGGTFTDVVMVNPSSGRLLRYKSFTTPGDPARGALDALAGILAESGAGWPPDAAAAGERRVDLPERGRGA